MYLDSFIDFINSTVKSRLGSKSAQARFHGICKIVDHGEDQGVVFYDNAGNDYRIGDDSFGLECYHRFTGFSFQANEQNAKDSFGDSVSTKTAFANFVMGVYGNRKSLEMTDQELMASVAFNFPDIVPSSLTNQLTGIQRAIISPMSTTNGVGQEPIKPFAENIFFTMNYRISITGDVGCLSQCNPDCI